MLLNLLRANIQVLFKWKKFLALFLSSDRCDYSIPIHAAAFVKQCSRIREATQPYS